MATKPDVKEMLAAGAHFGHKTSRWHPKMAPYIHSTRGGTHIIDLMQTESQLNEALAFITKTVASGKQVLLVGTKRQAKELVKASAESVDMPAVFERWMGGMLTNAKTINGRVKHLKSQEEKMASGELEAKYNKLEVQRFQEEIDRLNFLFGGIKNMAGKPGAVFVTDAIVDALAVKEAKKLGVPVIALVDTNADPSTVDYAIPCNDDALQVLELMLSYVAGAITDGAAKQKQAK